MRPFSRMVHTSLREIVASLGKPASTALLRMWLVNAEYVHNSAVYPRSLGLVCFCNYPGFWLLQKFLILPLCLLQHLINHQDCCFHFDFSLPQSSMVCLFTARSLAMSRLTALAFLQQNFCSQNLICLWFSWVDDNFKLFQGLGEILRWIGVLMFCCLLAKDGNTLAHRSLID